MKHVAPLILLAAGVFISIVGAHDDDNNITVEVPDEPTPTDEPTYADKVEFGSLTIKHLNLTIMENCSDTDYTANVTAEFQQYFCFLYRALQVAAGDFGSALGIVGSFPTKFAIPWAEFMELVDDFG
eukprot:141663_1